MILVVGFTGLLGYHLYKRLVNEGREVFGIDYTTDIRDKKAIENVFKSHNIKTVFHTVAHMPYTPNHDFAGVNVQGTKNLLEASVLHGVENFIHISTNSVYTKPPKYNPIDENHPNTNLDDYGTSKLYGEIACRLYSSYMGITILRPIGIYGKGMEERAIPKFIKQARNNEPIVIDGDSRQKRDFVYVEDLVDGICLAWRTKSHGTFNLGSGQPTTIQSLAEMIIRFTNSKSKIEFNDTKTEPYDYVLDITKAKNTFGYKPHPIQERLKEFINGK